MEATDRPQAPARPDGLYWILALVLLPLVIVGGMAGVFALIDDDAPDAAFLAVLVAAPACLVVLSGMALAQERAVRLMARRRRLVWAVVGGLLSAAVAAALGVALLIILFMHSDCLAIVC